ncbi:class I SAM-dependent methyltransferase [Corynebacterium aquatimens]|nr:methyltransferase [Corynebacterium aquatimens]WJY65606.1 Ribosomal RNA large subunit methyltransferase G [Corynebacterium aquatimens]
MRTLDRLILDTAAEGDASAITLDPTGALTAAALGSGRPVLSVDSDYSRAHAAHATGATVAGINEPLLIDDFLATHLPLTGASGIVAVGEMPKSLGRLDYLARSIAGAAARAGMAAQVVFGGNNKHLARSMNDVLAQSFDEVTASRGRGKFRCLVASGPRDVSYTPPTANGFTAYGGVFSGTKADHGGTFLATVVADLGVTAGSDAEPTVLDLGCGNGSVAKQLLEAGAVTAGQITATDADADAVLSARANLPGVTVTWDDAGSRFAEGSFDVIALNPPFHDRAGVDATLVQHLLDGARRLLAPGGELFMVHNSHLRYRGEVEKRFGRVQQAARNERFTVLRAG